MATIARIIVTETDLQNKTKLLTDFAAESGKLLNKGEKHQFVLLPAGFLTFIIKGDLPDMPLTEPENEDAKQKWNEKVGNLKEQALVEFRRSIDNETLKELKSVANYLVVGIDSIAAPKSKEKRIQLVLVFDLQSGKPLHWTGKSYPQPKERDCLIRMPMDTHFMERKICDKKVAVFGCHDLSIFNPRHQHHFSPFEDERKGKRRKENTVVGKIKCPLIDATLDFSPEIMLQLPHTEGTWAAKWTTLDKWLRRKTGNELRHFASGLKKNREGQKQYPLSGTQRGDVVNFADGRLIDK